eukprot:Lankesteria_metandrocarpae@DN3060_c0_g1_i1.p1
MKSAKSKKNATPSASTTTPSKQSDRRDRHATTDTAVTDKPPQKEAKTLSRSKPVKLRTQITQKSELVKRTEAAPHLSEYGIVLEEIPRAQEEILSTNRSEDVLQRLLSQLSDNLTRLGNWGTGHFRECSTNKAALKHKKSLKTLNSRTTISSNMTSSAKALRKSSVTEKRWETEFLLILRESQETLQLLSSQTAMVLDAQDAEIQTLKAQMQRLHQRGSIFQSQFEESHNVVRLKTVDNITDSIGAPTTHLVTGDACPTTTPANSTPVIVEGDVSTAEDSIHVADRNSTAVGIPPQPPVVPGLTLPPTNPINDQLDSLLLRVHSLLKNTGALTQRGSQVIDDASPINNAVPLNNTTGNAAASDGTSTKTVIPDNVVGYDNDYPKSQICAAQDTAEFPDESEEAVAALKAQTDRIKVEVMAISKTAYQMCRQLTNNFDSGIEEDTIERRVSVEDMKLRQCFLEEMQQGSWFFRIGRKFGAIGKALNSMFCKRCYVWVSSDFRDMYCTPNEPLPDQPSNLQAGSVAERLPKDLIVALPLHNVIGFAYGDASRAYRLQESRTTAFQPPHLCLSLWTKRQSLDLIALNEQEIERWFMGLNALLPLFPGRTFMTLTEFNITKDRLKSEFYERDASSDEDPGSSVTPLGGPSMHYAQMMYYHDGQGTSDSAHNIPTVF